MIGGNNYIRWSEGFDNNAGNDTWTDVNRWTNSFGRSAISTIKVANPLDGALTACQLVSPNTAPAGTSVVTGFEPENKSIPTGASHVFSVYAKAMAFTWILLEENSNPNQRQYFDLVHGVIGTPGLGVIPGLSRMTSVGQGWYRCQMGTIKGPDNLSPGASSTNHMVLRATPGDGVTVFPTVAGQVCLQIYGAQAELTDRLVGGWASPYTKTTYQQAICRAVVKT